MMPSSQIQLYVSVAGLFCPSRSAHPHHLIGIAIMLVQELLIVRAETIFS